MVLFQHIPHAALQSFVDYYFLMHIKLEAAQEPVLCPFPPTPLQFMVFYLDDPVVTKKEGEADFKSRARCIVVGPQATRMNLLVRKSHKCFVIAFHPGGLYRLLGIPMTELYDDGFDGRELVGYGIEEVVEQLQEAKDLNEMISVAEKYLLSRLSLVKELLPFDHGMKVLSNNHGLVSMEQIASVACMSLRQFERTCKHRIGYSPKFFARLARFSKAYRLRETDPSLKWTSIAYEAGYYDQMHFIRDFKQFAGITPSGMDEQIKANPFPMQASLRI